MTTPNEVKSMEALLLALDALENLSGNFLERTAAVRALEAAIALPVASAVVQEPVMHQFQTTSDGKWHNFDNDAHRDNTIADGRWPIRALAVVSAVEPTTQPKPSADGPTELWLQLHGDCFDRDLLEPVDYTNDEVTWCWHSIHDSDVRYVRADLAQPTPPPVAGDAQDARRYRHMRNNAAFQARNGPGLYWYLPLFSEGTLPERLDAAIDAAIAAGGKQI